MRSWFLLGLSTLTLRNNILEYFDIVFLCRPSEVVGNDAMLWQLICGLGIQIKTNKRYTQKIFWFKLLKNKRPKGENFDHFDHVSCNKYVRD